MFGENQIMSSKFNHKLAFTDERYQTLKINEAIELSY